MFKQLKIFLVSLFLATGCNYKESKCDISLKSKLEICIEHSKNPLEKCLCNIQNKSYEEIVDSNWAGYNIRLNDKMYELDIKACELLK